MSPQDAYTQYHKMIRKLALKMTKYLPSYHFLDLFQEGCVALLKALDTHDPNKGALSTHIYHTTKGAMFNYIRRNYSQVHRNNQSMHDALWRGEIPHDFPLDAPLRAAPSLTSRDLVPDHTPSVLSQLIYHEHLQGINNTISTSQLSSRDRLIISERLMVDFQERTRLRDLGAREGVCYEAIRASENRLIKKLERKLERYQKQAKWPKCLSKEP